MEGARSSLSLATTQTPAPQVTMSAAVCTPRPGAARRLDSAPRLHVGGRPGSAKPITGPAAREEGRENAVVSVRTAASETGTAGMGPPLTPSSLTRRAVPAQGCA